MLGGAAGVVSLVLGYMGVHTVKIHKTGVIGALPHARVSCAPG